MRILNNRISIMWKGLAALSIMLAHTRPQSLSTIFNYYIDGYLWVGLFFFFTGYGLQISATTKNNYLDDFFKKRIVRVYIPFAFAEALYCLFYVALKKKLTISTIVKSIIGIELRNSILWYVIEVLVIYAFFYLVKKVTKKNELCTWIILYVLFVSTHVLMGVGSWWYKSTACLLIGLFSNKITYLIKKIRHSEILIYLLFLTLFLFSKTISFGNDEILTFSITWNDAMSMVLAPLFVISCILITEHIVIGNNCLNNILVFFGNISYEIYLYHMMFAFIFSYTKLNESLQFVIVIICTISFSWAANKFYRPIAKALTKE